MSDADPLVAVGYASDMVEAQIIQGLLESQGIPSTLRSEGINGPQVGYPLLPRNPHRVLVVARDADRAREALAEAQIPSAAGGPGAHRALGAVARGYLTACVVFAAAFGVFAILRAL
jgi:hypothetical protein